MSYQEIDFVCLIIQKSQISGDIRTGKAKLIQYKKTGEIEIETNEEFSPFYDTRGFFTAYIELPEQYSHIQDFELVLDTDSELSEFRIFHNHEYQRLQNFLLFEKLDAKVKNKSDTIPNKLKI